MSAEANDGIPLKSLLKGLKRKQVLMGIEFERGILSARLDRNSSVIPPPSQQQWIPIDPTGSSDHSWSNESRLLVPQQPSQKSPRFVLEALHPSRLASFPNQRKRHNSHVSTNVATGSKSSCHFVSDFHSTLWQSMVQRSFIPERTLHHKDFEFIGAIELFETFNLLDTVTKLPPFVKTIVLEISQI